MKLSGMEVPRPMTHDLVVSVVEHLGAVVEKLVIDKLVENTFHAKLELKPLGGEVKQVDCRPSDGIALAVRTGCDIFVDEEVLKKTAFLKQ